MADNSYASEEPTLSDDGVDRRRLLTLAAGGAVLASGIVLPASAAEAHGTIKSYPGIWGQRTVYQATRKLKSFRYRPSFHSKMNDWLELWFKNTSYEKPLRVWTSLVHSDGSSSAAHNQGRAFDLTGIYVGVGSDSPYRAFRADYNNWKNLSGSALVDTRRKYWATAASLHYHFRWVRTYLHGSGQKSNIHIDNMKSGTGKPYFKADKSQIQHVQACCRYLWGKGTTIDGVWGSQAKRHSHEVLERIGKGGYLGSSKSHWQAFNRASMRKGYNTQAY
ncbi:hypothetical protein L0U85_12445 [Glycomyces sp. L485]|uniref:hypothetical protein n=1 Tax=Glycomyces sp. L485 TaxID=2909235 RepID=UPI001F4BBCC6|nr:hypothetical protein [Glycomyces sp. L485]MCH7231655.1 hypothetical protein [Glycomyces sp. L485]